MESSVGSPVDLPYLRIDVCKRQQKHGLRCQECPHTHAPRVVIHEQLHPQREQELVAVGAVPRSQVTARAVVVQDLDKRRRDARIRGI